MNTNTIDSEIVSISINDNLPVNDVITILRFSLILDKDNCLREKYIGMPLIEAWDSIPYKKFWLGMYKDQVKRSKRSKR